MSMESKVTRRSKRIAPFAAMLALCGMLTITAFGENLNSIANSISGAIPIDRQVSSALLKSGCTLLGGGILMEFDTYKNIQRQDKHYIRFDRWEDWRCPRSRIAVNEFLFTSTELEMRRDTSIFLPGRDFSQGLIQREDIISGRITP